MAIAPGRRFGPYEVLEPIGAGGMGEVYRATDTNLKRSVAIKVIPDTFANDADRLARFQREAEVLAALNHPNIAHIYGLEKADADTVIVMELVDGPTLADRIAEGPLPADEALGIARQIADALEAAHARQIVHRDLKPHNIKLRPDGAIKVLDFGIAKALDARAISGISPVMTTPAVTETGVILGTAAYMSPEQARGKPVDQRTDIWAFGCLLFEMLTGQPAFGGEDIMLTLARVLDRDTDMSSVPGTVSPAVRHTIKLCLEKDPRRRISDIRDVRLALDGAFETDVRGGLAAAEPRPGLGRGLVVVPAAVLLTALAAWYLKPAPSAAPGIVTRFEHVLPEGLALRNPVMPVIDIAPNGEYFVVNSDEGFYVRAMNDAAGRLLPGTAGDIGDVVVSPDGREVAYFRAGAPGAAGVQLIKIAISGGAPVVLADSLATPYGLSWGADGSMLFGQPDGIWRVSQSGGRPVRLIQTEGGEQVFGPRSLPGGEWVLFTLARTAGANRWDEADIVAESLATGERRVLRSGGSDARYLPTGHLTYVFNNVLFASAFDAARLELDEERVPLVQGVQTAVPIIGGSGFYALSGNGTLVYVPGTREADTGGQRHLVWVDREGDVEPLSVRTGDYTMARISPDGKRIALVVGSMLPPSNPPPDIYLFDVETENLTQLTFDAGGDDGPVWSRDGSRIYYRSYREDGVAAVYVIPSDGGTPELVARSPVGDNPLPWSISPDDGTLLLIDALSFDDVNLATLDLEGREIAPLLDVAVQVTEPSLSPDGRWMVYAEFSEQAQSALGVEINLRPYPDVRQQRRPVGAGASPVFSADGATIFLFDGNGLSAASVQYSPLRVGAPRQLFRGEYWYGVSGPQGNLGRAWDVDPLNDRFLMITVPTFGAADDDDPRPRVNVVVNWFEELRERVPLR